MPQKSPRFWQLCLLLLFSNPAAAVTLTSGDSDYTTSADITVTSGSGISSTFSGTSSSLRKVKNLHAITTGNSGTVSSAYGIKFTGDYNQVTNDSSASITTTGSSGRGISLSDNSIAINSGSITTSGSTSYAIYAGGDSNNITSSGTITTSGSTSYGIYLSGSSNVASNSGTISTKVYGIYGDGDANQISNSGTITTTSGSSAHGIFVSTGSTSTASASNYSTVTNSGSISANANGIYNKDNYSQITNSGSISSGDDDSDYGIRNEGSNATITNSGDITSTTYAIYNSGSNSVINNSGNLTGGVVMGSSTLNISGGNISGEVDGETLGDVNINANFNQSAAFTNLNNLNINGSNTLTSSASISANAISIASGASLTFASGSSVSGTISGSGSLNISATNFSTTAAIGSSSESLTNLNINSGATLTSSSDIYANNISLAGTLNFNGADNLTIVGDLAGSGSGTFNVGENSQNISGNFSLNSGDIFSSTLGNGTAGNLTISDSATINAASKLEITPSSSQGYIVDGTQFTLISGGSGSAINKISDENISVNGNDSNIYGLLKFTTAAVSDSLVLTINRLAPSEVTSNQNSQSIYSNLNAIGTSASGNLSDFQTYLDNSGLTGDALAQALNQAAPQSSKANLLVINNIVNNSTLSVESRIYKARDHLENGFWVETFGNSSSQNAVKDDDGFKANSLGIVLGADHEITPDTMIGAALSFSRSNVKSSDERKENLISSNQLSIYAGQKFEKYFLDYLAGFAWNLLSSSRAITALDATATARYSGQTYVAKIKGGRVYELANHFFFTPEISLNILRTSISDYSEKGAEELNLKVSAVSANFLESRIGAGLGWETRIPDVPEFKKVIALLKFSYGHAFINDAPTTSASFDGQASTFETKISHQDKNSIKAGFELAAHHENFTSFSADYNFEKRETYQSHFLAVKVRQEF